MTFDIRNSVILITVRGHGSHAAEIVLLHFSDIMYKNSVFVNFLLFLKWAGVASRNKVFYNLVRSTLEARMYLGRPSDSRLSLSDVTR